VSGVRAGIEFVRMMVRGMMVCGLGFGVSGLGLGVWSLEFGVWGVGFKVEGVGCVSGDATPCKDTLVILHGVVSPECGAFSRAASTSFRSSTLISHKGFTTLFCKSQFPHKPINLFFILVIIKMPERPFFGRIEDLLARGVNVVPKILPPGPAFQHCPLETTSTSRQLKNSVILPSSFLLPSSLSGTIPSTLV